MIGHFIAYISLVCSPNFVPLNKLLPYDNPTRRFAAGGRTALCPYLSSIFQSKVLPLTAGNPGKAIHAVRKLFLYGRKRISDIKHTGMGKGAQVRSGQ